MSGPVRLTPSLRDRVWGRKRLAPWFPDAKEPIGEVWYQADHELPLLVKLIFTSERLSVQVHPDDGEAGARGKTEMWHIVEAEPGATIALGFREPITRERLRQSTRTREIEDLLRWFPVAAGETYFTPAHTVHAIGGGIVLWEIQQNSDVTYRLWDYGRPREIHVEQASAIAHLGVHPGPACPEPNGPGCELLVRSKHFVTETLRLSPDAEIQPAPEKCQMWICLEGCGRLGEELIQPSEVWLLPEAGEQPVLRAETGMRLLRTYVPGGAN